MGEMLGRTNCGSCSTVCTVPRCVQPFSIFAINSMTTNDEIYLIDQRRVDVSKLLASQTSLATKCVCMVYQKKVWVETRTDPLKQARTATPKIDVWYMYGVSKKGLG